MLEIEVEIAWPAQRLLKSWFGYSVARFDLAGA
jgi:hypothetical protein